MNWQYPHHEGWIIPHRDGFRFSCCDCGLVHLLKFKLTPAMRGKHIKMFVERDERATKRMRRRLRDGTPRFKRDERGK